MEDVTLDQNVANYIAALAQDVADPPQNVIDSHKNAADAAVTAFIQNAADLS